MPQNSILPSPADIRAAATRIAPHIMRTELRRSVPLSDFLGGDVFLKLECEQLTGAYKIRGATNALAMLTPEQCIRGVVTASAGNHGLGLATAARRLHIEATIFIPHNAPAIKRSRLAETGASIDSSAANYDAAEQLARASAARTGATWVSPCTGRSLLAGQGTVALEVLEDLPSLKTIVAGVGGGGLTGGMAGLLRAESPQVRIVGAQTEHTNAMSLALLHGRPTEIPDAPTLADGLAGLVDAEMLAQGQAALDAVAVVSEQDLANTIAFLWSEEGLKVEGAGAVSTAAALGGQLLQALRRANANVVTPSEIAFPLVLVVTGGNIDDEKHRFILRGAL